MKRNLILLTGIVFLIAILAAGGCKNPDEQKDTGQPTLLTESELDSILDDPSTKHVYLKDTLLKSDGRVHLEMYNSKHPEKKVIDSLATGIRVGYTVVWEKVHASDIKAIYHIRPVEADTNIFRNGIDTIRTVDRTLYRLEVPLDAHNDTIKYEIVFSIKKDGGTWCIDPFLELPGDH